MLIFRLADSSQSRAKANADALGIVARPSDARVRKRELRGGDGKLRVAIETLEAMGWKKFFRRPIVNLAAAMRVKDCRVETADTRDAAPFRAHSVPEIIDTCADAGDRTDAGDDRAAPAHAASPFGQGS